MALPCARGRELDVLKEEAESYEAMRRAQQDDPKAAGKNYANVLSQINTGKYMGEKIARHQKRDKGTQ